MTLTEILDISGFVDVFLSDLVQALEVDLPGVTAAVEPVEDEHVPISGLGLQQSK